MNGKQLKNSILQWAIQGKLVPQDPNDEPASVLLDKIRQEKERLIKEKKIKRDKNASIIYRGEDNSYYEKMLATGEVKCIDEEVPFDLPSGWEWCRLRNLVTVFGRIGFRGYTKEDMVSVGKGAIALSPSNMMDNGSMNYSSMSYINWRKYEESPEIKIRVGDILIVKTGSSYGKTCLVEELPSKATINPQIAVLKYIYANRNWLTMVLSSPICRSQFEQYVIGTSIPTFSQEKLSSTLLPIAPAEEQKRIAEVFKKLTPLINKYQHNYLTIEKLNSELPNKIKSSILQEAIQGKLVPQITEEGSAKELLAQIKAEKLQLVKEGKLKKSALVDSVIFKGDDNKYWEKTEDDAVCIDEEIPFEIPSNWAWVRLDDICSFIHRGKSPKYSPIKKYPVVAQKCNQWVGFSIEKAKFIEPQSITSYNSEYFLQDRDLMWNSTGLGTLGRMAIYYTLLNPYELAVADSHVTVIRPYKTYIVSEYLYYYFASNTVQSVIEDKSDGSTKQKELATKTVKSYLVPLPPFAEQLRIVQKIESVTSIMS